MTGHLLDPWFPSWWQVPECFPGCSAKLLGNGSTLQGTGAEEPGDTGTGDRQRNWDRPQLVRLKTGPR